MSPMELVIVRPAEVGDHEQLAAMFHSLWPTETTEEHSRELGPLIACRAPGILPSVVLVAETFVEGVPGRLAGFVQAGLRSHADGCDPSHPVGYLEGWFVGPAWRRKGVGARLVGAAEAWARAQGCVEMASDTWWDNEGSQRAHEALGFEVVDRCVNYRKRL